MYSKVSGSGRRYWVLFLPLFFSGFLSCELLGQQEVVELDIRSSDPNWGHTSPPSRQFEKGSEVTIQARPHESWGYLFDEWSGDVTGTENPLTFTIEKDTEVVANFRPVDITLNVIIEGEGRVDHRLLGSGDSYSDELNPGYPGGSQVQVRAVPDDGWEFDVWRGQNFTFNRRTNPESIGMFGPRTVKAIFKPAD